MNDFDPMWRAELCDAAIVHGQMKILCGLRARRARPSKLLGSVRKWLSTGVFARRTC